MADPLAQLEEAVRALRNSWAGDDAPPVPPVAGLDRSRLIAAHDAAAMVARLTGAIQAGFAAEIARESRRELGPDALATQHGFRNPVALIAATTGTSTSDAVRLVKVGEATAPRTTLTGHAAPPRHPHVADALTSGRIGTMAASAIITMLDRVALRATPADCDQAEELLAARAPGLTADQLAKLITRAQAHLDPDGLEPAERDRRADRSLTMFERDGMLHLTGRFDAESAAPIKTVIESVVSAQFRASRDLENAGVDADPRSLPQRQADALTLVAQHLLGCDHDMPLGGATVIVRVTVDDLVTGTGHATIDGINQPISIAAARRLAAGGGVIPCVLDSNSEILDWGRNRRFFTQSQRLALAERDGGCAMCGLPPSMTKAHHLKWWQRDTGPTDLRNGVLLCESCHHRIHDNGWEIHIDGTTTAAKVWFIPPPHIDPTRTPRLGGRARYDYTPEHTAA